MPRAFVGLGSNLGDRLATLRAAVADLAALGRVTARSSVWETEALGPPPDYLNAAVALETALDPAPLLEAMLEVERRHGRVRSVPFAPRTLDLDLLLYDDLVLSLPGLELPHPRLAERAFVLAPLDEVAAEVTHPVLHCSIRTLRLALPGGRRARRLADPL